MTSKKVQWAHLPEGLAVPSVSVVDGRVVQHPTRVTLAFAGEQVEAELVELDFEKTDNTALLANDAAARLAGTHEQTWRVLTGTYKGHLLKRGK